MTSAEAAPPDASEAFARARIGQVLRTKWRLDSLLGVGGMAAVYAATHRNGSRVAVKILHAELCAHQEVLRRFTREGLVANTVDHEGVVRVSDAELGPGDDFCSVWHLFDLLPEGAAGWRPQFRYASA